MEKIIVVPENVTSYVFYNEIMNDVFDSFDETDIENFIFDFSKVNFINPKVFPNLLSLGIILKNYLKKSPQIYFIPNPNLFKYLDEIKFFYINRKFGIFELNEDVIGGYSTDTRGMAENCAIHFFDVNTRKKEIFEKYSNYYLLALKNKHIKDEKARRLIDIISEFTENACIHSETGSFVSSQINTNKYFYVSISDYGIGFRKSFGKKEKEKGYLPQFYRQFPDSSYINLFSIIEAIFYNSKKKVYGIFSGIKAVLELNGTIRIHSTDTQLILTKSNFEKYLLVDIQNEDEKNDFVNSFAGSLMLSPQKELQYSALRLTRYKFKGVHIEIEIPLIQGEV